MTGLALGVERVLSLQVGLVASAIIGYAWPGQWWVWTTGSVLIGSVLVMTTIDVLAWLEKRRTAR